MMSWHHRNFVLFCLFLFLKTFIILPFLPIAVAWTTTNLHFWQIDSPMSNQWKPVHSGGPVLMFSSADYEGRNPKVVYLNQTITHRERKTFCCNHKPPLTRLTSPSGYCLDIYFDGCFFSIRGVLKLWTSRLFKAMTQHGKFWPRIDFSAKNDKTRDLKFRGPRAHWAWLIFESQFVPTL